MFSTGKGGTSAPPTSSQAATSTAASATAAPFGTFGAPSPATASGFGAFTSIGGSTPTPAAAAAPGFGSGAGVGITPMPARAVSGGTFGGFGSSSGNVSASGAPAPASASPGFGSGIGFGFTPPAVSGGTFGGFGSGSGSVLTSGAPAPAFAAPGFGSAVGSGFASMPAPSVSGGASGGFGSNSGNVSTAGAVTPASAIPGFGSGAGFGSNSGSFSASGTLAPTAVKPLFGAVQTTAPTVSGGTFGGFGGGSGGGSVVLGLNAPAANPAPTTSTSLGAFGSTTSGASSTVVKMFSGTKTSGFGAGSGGPGASVGAPLGFGKPAASSAGFSFASATGPTSNAINSASAAPGAFSFPTLTTSSTSAPAPTSAQLGVSAAPTFSLSTSGPTFGAQGSGASSFTQSSSSSSGGAGKSTPSAPTGAPIFASPASAKAPIGGFSFGASAPPPTPVFWPPASAPAAVPPAPSARTLSFGTPTVSTSASAPAAVAPAPAGFGASSTSAPAPVTSAPASSAGTFKFGTSASVVVPTSASPPAVVAAAPAGLSSGLSSTSVPAPATSALSAVAAAPSTGTFKFGIPASSAVSTSASAPDVVTAAPAGLSFGLSTSTPAPATSAPAAAAAAPSAGTFSFGTPASSVVSTSAPDPAAAPAAPAGLGLGGSSAPAPVAGGFLNFGRSAAAPSVSAVSIVTTSAAASIPTDSSVSAPAAPATTPAPASASASTAFGPAPTPASIVNASPDSAPPPEASAPVSASAAATSASASTTSGSLPSGTPAPSTIPASAPSDGSGSGSAGNISKAPSGVLSFGVSPPISASALGPAPAPSGPSAAPSTGFSLDFGAAAVADMKGKIPGVVTVAGLPKGQGLGAAASKAPPAFTPASAGDPDAVDTSSDEFWRNADDEQVSSLMSAPDSETPRLLKLALLQGSAGQRLQAGLLNYYKKPNAESLKKVLDGKVALTAGKREEPLPGGEAEGNFCISLSKMLRLDEVQSVQVLHAHFRRENSKRPRGSSAPRASEGFDFLSQRNLFKVREYHEKQRLAQLQILHELLRKDLGDDSSLLEIAREVLDLLPDLLKTMLDLVKELFSGIPPPAATVRGISGFGTRSALAASKSRKNSWVEQRVSELTELASCMVIAGYNRYPINASQTSLAVNILTFIQKTDFSMPPSFEGFIAPGSKVFKKARSFSYMMAMLGVQALDLQSVAVDCPDALKQCHPFFSYLYSRDAAVVQAAKTRLTMVDETLASMLDGTKSDKAAAKWRSMTTGSSEDLDLPQTLVVIAWGVLLRNAYPTVPGLSDGWGVDAGRGSMIFAVQESSLDFLAETGRGLVEISEEIFGQGSGIWSAEAALFSALCTPPALRLGPSPRRSTPPSPQEVVLPLNPNPDSTVCADLFLLVVSCFVRAVHCALPMPTSFPLLPDEDVDERALVEHGRATEGRGGFGPEHLGEVEALSRIAAETLRGQTTLSLGALEAARKYLGPFAGAGALILGAARSLFPLSIGSFARLLGSLVHDQDTADIAHAILAGIEDEGGESGMTDAGSTAKAARDSEHRYVAILPGRGGHVWYKTMGGRSDGDETVVSTGERIFVSRSFVVTDTGMTVRAGTECEVIRGNKNMGDDSSDIYLRFTHPEPPWAILVGRLDAMLTEFQGLENRFTVASAKAVSGRVAETQAVVKLMNTIFRHSEFGPLRAETVLRSSRAQAWLVVKGLPNLAKLLKESRRTLEGELRTGRCDTIPEAKAEVDRAGGAEALISAFEKQRNPLPLDNGTDCFAAQLPRILVRMLRALLPLLSSHPPRRPSGLRKPFGQRGGKEAAETALGESLYDLATAAVELLGTLAAHGASAEIRGIGLEAASTEKGTSGVNEGRGTGGNRWATEITIEFGDADGSGGRWSGGGYRVGSGVNILDVCWKVSTNVDGRHGTYAFTGVVLRLIREVLQHLGQANLSLSDGQFAVTNQHCLHEAGSRMVKFVTLALPSLQDWGFRGFGQRWGLSLLCLQSLRVVLDQPLPAEMMTALPSDVVSPFPVARKLRADVSQAVTQNTSVGTAVAACMSLLVASAATKRKAGDGVTGFSNSMKDSASAFTQSFLPVDFTEAYLWLEDDEHKSLLDIVTALAQEAFVVLERVLTENACLSASVAIAAASGRQGNYNGQDQAVAAAAARDAVSGVSRLLLRPAEGREFVAWWPFGVGFMATEVPSFALLAAALSSFPDRLLAFDGKSLDPCAARLPALANATLASLVRCGFPYSSSSRSQTGLPATDASMYPTSTPFPGIDMWSSVSLAGAAGDGRRPQRELTKPLSDSLSPGDAFQWRLALVEAISAAPVSSPSGRERDGDIGRIGEEREERRNAALDLLLSAVKEQPALVVVLFWSRSPENRGSGYRGKADSASVEEGAGVEVPKEGSVALSETVLSLLKVLSMEMPEGHRVLAGDAEALVKALDLVLALWKSEGVGRLGEAVFALAASEEFWGLITTVLIQDLSWDTRSRHASPDGGWSTGRPLQGGGERGLNGPQTARLCNTLRCHAIVLEILSLEMHRGLRPLGAGAFPNKDYDGAGLEFSRAAAKAVEGFIKKNIEAYFGCWASMYTLFSLDPGLGKKAKDLAADIGVDIDGDLAVPADERVPGDGFLYHIPCLERILGLAPHESFSAEGHDGTDAGGHGRRTSFSGEGISKKAALRLACEAANRNWSLAEAEANTLRAFRAFVEVCVLRRQPGYQRISPPPESLQNSGNPNGKSNGEFDSGEVSPARTPVVSRVSGGGTSGSGGLAQGFGAAAGTGSVASEGSDFLGDKRSFAMVRIAAHRLAGEKRKGWAVVIVVSEMCDALVSMLHHQLHEVVQKALDPGRSIVRRRDPAVGRLSRGVKGQMGADACDQTLATLAPALEGLFDVAPLSRVLDVENGVDGYTDANMITRATTISLCLRVRLRLLTAGLLLLRAAGGTAEHAAASAASAREGGDGTSAEADDIGEDSSAQGKDTRSLSSDGTAGAGGEELSPRASREARLMLFRRACATLEELDALEEAYDKRRGKSYHRRAAKRGPGVSLHVAGLVEVAGDKAMRANLTCVCLSIMQEMTVPRGYLRRGGDNASADHRPGGDRESGWDAVRMELEMEGIVGQQKIIPRLLRRARKASHLACASFSGLHSTPTPPATSASERYRNSHVDRGGLRKGSEKAAGTGAGNGNDSGERGSEDETLETEGVGLLQLIYGFFASSAARGRFINVMVEAGVLGAMMDDPLVVLLRQASSNPQACLPRGYNNRSEPSAHWRCYILAMRMTSDLASSFHNAKRSPPGSKTTPTSTASLPGVLSISSRNAETGLEQVLQFLEVFEGIMVDGLSTLPSVAAVGGRSGQRFTLELLQERVDIAGLIGALGPSIPKWRALYPDTSVALLEAVRQATRTAAVLLVPDTGPPPTKAVTGVSRGKTPGGGGDWSSPPNKIAPVLEFTPMQQTTPTPRRVRGMVELSGGGVSGVVGAGTAGLGPARGGGDSNVPELIKSCFVAISDGEKTYLEMNTGRSNDSSSGSSGEGVSAMSMATPSPVRGGGGAVVGIVVNAERRKGSLGYFSRVEDGITAFLVLALGILRLVSPQPEDVFVESGSDERNRECRDPEAAIPIFAYQALQNLPHVLPRQYSPHRVRQGVEGGFFGGRSGSPGQGFGTSLSGAWDGMVFEGLYHEPSLGHLVGLVRHYVHRMEVVSKEEDSAVGVGGVVSNDERNARRWRLGQLGYIAEVSLWMLVVNTLAHECGGGGNAPAPSLEERRQLHDEIVELFETRLEQHAPLWESLGQGEGGRAPVSIGPGFVAHMKGMIQGWIEEKEAKAAREEKDPKAPKAKSRAGRGAIWSPQGNDTSINRAW